MCIYLHSCWKSRFFFNKARIPGKLCIKCYSFCAVTYQNSWDSLETVKKILQRPNKYELFEVFN